jgi:hypothetical protein
VIVKNIEGTSGHWISVYDESDVSQYDKPLSLLHGKPSLFLVASVLSENIEGTSGHWIKPIEVQYGILHHGTCEFGITGKGRKGNESTLTSHSLSITPMLRSVPNNINGILSPDILVGPTSMSGLRMPLMLFGTLRSIGVMEREWEVRVLSSARDNKYNRAKPLLRSSTCDATVE